MIRDKISFVTVNYNRFNLLKESVDKIKTFSKSIEYEHIIVDNNSTDGNILDHLTQSENLKIIKNKENAGWPSGINKAILNSDGEYICIIDNDVILVDDIGSKILEFYKDNNALSICGPQILNSDLTKQNSIADFPNISHKFFEIFFLNKVFYKNRTFNYFYKNHQSVDEKVIEVEMLIGACLFFPKVLFEKLGALNEKYFLYSSDTQFCWDVKNYNGKVLFNTEVQVIHKCDLQENTLSLMTADLMALDQITFLRNNYSVLRRRVIYILMLFNCITRIALNFLLGIFSFKKVSFLKSKYFVKKAIYTFKGILKF